MVKSLLYSPEVLGGLSILTQGLAGKSPEVVMPSLMQGVQTASAMSKFEDEEDKKHYFKILEDSEGNVIGEVEVDAQGNELKAKPAKKKAAKKSK